MDSANAPASPPPGGGSAEVPPPQAPAEARARGALVPVPGPGATPASRERTLAAAERAPTTSQRMRRAMLSRDPAMQIRLDRAAWVSGRTPLIDDRPPPPARVGKSDDPTEAVPLILDPVPLSAARRQTPVPRPWMEGPAGPDSGRVLVDVRLGGMLHTTGALTRYRAELVRDSSPVEAAVRMVDVATAAEAVARCTERVRAVLAHHAPLVPVLALVHRHDRLALVRSAEPRRDLSAEIRQARQRHQCIGGERSAQLVDGIADALAALHAVDLVHGQLAPWCVRLTEDGMPLLDGIDALLREPAEPIEPVPGYTSPEQAAGLAPGAPADCYALGVLLYELLTGRLPFLAATPAEMLRQHREAAPEPPQALDPGISDRDQALVLRLLAKDPAERPRAQEVRDALRPATPSAPPAPVAAEAVAPALPWWQRWLKR